MSTATLESILSELALAESIGCDLVSADHDVMTAARILPPLGSSLEFDCQDDTFADVSSHDIANHYASDGVRDAGDRYDSTAQVVPIGPEWSSSINTANDWVIIDAPSAMTGLAALEHDLLTVPMARSQHDVSPCGACVAETSDTFFERYQQVFPLRDGSDELRQGDDEDELREGYGSTSWHFCTDPYPTICQACIISKAARGRDPYHPPFLTFKLQDEGIPVNHI